jgi:hypothetical protein
MSSPSRLTFLAMCVSFALCILGLIAGLLYSLFESFLRHRTLESILSRTIPYYKFLGALGILGMLLFFVFLLFQIAGPGSRSHHE